jgi:DnaK suppressor protein
MSGKTATFDEAFVARQRQRLIQLREQLSKTTQAEATEEAGIQSQSLGEARESEDDAQRLALLDIDGTFIARNLLRLPQIERALKKIDDATYGFSDASGKPIPRARLEAIPEAVYTVAEEAAHATAR